MKTTLGIALLGVVGVPALPAAAAPARAAGANAYDGDYKRLESFRSLHDLPLMEKTCDRLFARWKKTNPSHFVDLSCEACEVLSSINFHSPRQFTLAQHYALDALNDPVPKSINDQSCLVMYGLSHPAVGQGGRRKEIVHWWLSTWRRIGQGGIAGFDPKNYPYTVTAGPPAGLRQGFFSGMSSANIKDPKLRREYEQAIARNRQNALVVGEQRSLRELKRTFEPVAERVIAALYASDPDGRAELDSLLNADLTDGAARREILAAVERMRSNR